MNLNGVNIEGDVLTLVEVNALVAIVVSALGRQRAVGKGTFMLSGQKYGGAPMNLLRFDLPEGPFGGEDGGDNQWFELATKYLAGNSHAGSRVQKFNRRDTLILEATAGRFICTCAVEKHREADNIAYLVAAETLALLRPSDGVLMRSAGDIFWQIIANNQNLKDLDKYAQSIFNKGTPKKVAGWRNWYRDFQANGPSKTLFFN